MARTGAGTSATQQVYERLRTELLSAALRPGTRLKIAELCERLGVSPGAVRETLSRLTSDGLIVCEPQRGFRVAPISARELRDLTTVRVEVEALCLRRTIDAGDADWERRVSASLDRLLAIPQRRTATSQVVDDAWAAMHREFHETLVSACGSPWLLRHRDLLFAQSERYRRLSVPLSGFARDVEREHAQIARAALSREADLAVALMTSHLLVTTRILLEQGFEDRASERSAREPALAG